MKHLLFGTMSIFLLVSSPHCTEKKKKNNTDSTTVKAPVQVVAQGYDFANPGKVELPASLVEVSGINYIGNHQLAAEQDEDGIIYIVNITTGNIENSWKFGPGNDYEDIVTLDDFYYLLASNGDIYKVDRQQPSKKTTVKFSFGKRGKEFESLYADGKRLVMICKSCDGNQVDAWSFDLEKEVYGPSPVYSIDEAQVRKKFNLGKQKLKPSAAAIHPVEKKLYILCSIGSVVLVCNLQGETENVYSLNPNLYPQPEGITFAPNGDMYISNEGGGGEATLLKITYQPK